jgi:geranylgeranyl diphosphate synthase type II
MDNDDFRRGKPSNHKRFGEAMAILAGDSLLNRAFEVMANACLADFKKENIEAMAVISAASGALGMAAGQAKDMSCKEASPHLLNEIYSLKTGAMFIAAFEAGAIIGGADRDMITKVKEVGQKLGLAFQIQDDLLEADGDSEVLGKPVNSDTKNKKNTYVTVHGYEAAKADYERISAEALKIFEAIPQKSHALHDIINKVIHRTK